MSDHENAGRTLALLLALALVTPTLAQTDPVSQAETRHLRELIALHDRINGLQFDAQKQAVSVALSAAREANEKFERETKQRLDVQNEFRGQLKDQASTFITRAELLGWLIAVISICIAILNYRKGSPTTGRNP